MSMPDEIQKVLDALANREYKWRTIPGVSNEANVEPEIVREIIAQNRDIIVRSAIPAASGEPLYTTREHYQESGSFTDKILGILKNRAD